MRFTFIFHFSKSSLLLFFMQRASEFMIIIAFAVITIYREYFSVLLVRSPAPQTKKNHNILVRNSCCRFEIHFNLYNTSNMIKN